MRHMQHPPVIVVRSSQEIFGGEFFGFVSVGIFRTTTARQKILGIPPVEFFEFFQGIDIIKIVDQSVYQLPKVFFLVGQAPTITTPPVPGGFNKATFSLVVSVVTIPRRLFGFTHAWYSSLVDDYLFLSYTITIPYTVLSILFHLFFSHPLTLPPRGGTFVVHHVFTWR